MNNARMQSTIDAVENGNAAKALDDAAHGDTLRNLGGHPDVEHDIRRAFEMALLSSISRIVLRRNAQEAAHAGS